MAPGAIRARDFGFTYRGGTVPALQGIDLDVAPGDCLLVVGPSGSGKSTFGLALAGLVPREIPGHVAGSLTVDGRETVSVESATLAAQVGLVFQDPAVQLVMDRVEDEVAFGLENRDWPHDRMRSRVPEILVDVGLGGLERRHVRDLSGGQQQRLALAGVLAPQPGILVLDEPTANLDPAGTAAFFERLAWIRAGGAATIVLVEHRVESAWPLADVILALGSDGAPIAVGTPDSVLRDAGQKMAAAGIWLPEGEPARATGEQSRGRSGATGEPLLEANGVTFGFDEPVPVLHGVDLSAAAGERIALIGPNGGGKTTLGRLLVGLLRPQRGEVRLAGRDPARLAAGELARLAGYVFQRPEQQFLAQRVSDEAMLGLRPEERDAAARLLDRLGLPLGRFGDRSPHRLSGGEQRRLSLACTLVRRPGLLILDEPTFGQDRHGYEALLEIVRDMVDRGTCLIAATHDERFVRDTADRIVVVEDGRIVSDRPAVATPT